MQVWVSAVVTSRTEMRLAATFSEAAMWHELYDGVVDWWSEEEMGGPIPEDHKTAVEAYFEQAPEVLNWEVQEVSV